MPRPAPKGWTNEYINKIRQESSTGRPFIYLQDHAYKQDQKFYDKLELDPQIRAAIENVAADVAGIDWTLTSDKDSDIIPIYRDALKCIRHFNTARMVMAKQSLMRGFCVHKPIWEPRVIRLGEDERARRWIVPVRLADIGVDRVRRSAEPVPGNNQGLKVFRWNIWDHQDNLWKQIDPGEEWQYIWSVYMPEESTLGYGNGIGKSLYYLYRLKTVLLELVAGFAERSVDSWIVLKLEHLASTDNLYDDTDSIDQLIDVVEKMRAHGILAVTGESDVQTLSPSTQQWQLMTEMLDKLDRQILILIKGSNLDMELDGGGSYAAAKTHHEVSNKRLILQREMVIAEPLSNWLLPAFYHLNRPNFEAMGKTVHEIPVYNVSGGEIYNPQERLPVFQDAFDKGIPIAKRDYYEQMGLSPVEPGEEVIKVQQQQPQGGFPGGGFSAQFAQSPMQKQASGKMPFKRTPPELQEAIQEYTIQKARWLDGQNVDMEAVSMQLADKLAKIMAFSHATGELDVVDESADDLEEDHGDIIKKAGL